MYLFSLLIIISCTFANNHYTKCDFSDEINHSNATRSRPDTDTYAPSPNNIFYIHYDLSGGDAPSQNDINSNGIPDYIDEVGIAAEHSLDIITNQLGFETFIPDDDGIYDIYIEDRGPGSYGVNYLDIDNMGNPLGGSSYIEIDNKFEQGEYFTTGLSAMRVTVAHELFHAIQRSYQIHPTFNIFLYEMTSTWIEDIAYPDVNDYIYWTDTFFDNPEQAISDTDGYSIALYGHYLTSVVNSGIIKEIWEKFSNVNNATYSINFVLDDTYNSSFIDSWIDFCSRNVFNGQYTNMNNNFYYYADQMYADPLTYNTIEPLTGNISIDDLFLHDDQVTIKLFEPNSNFIIDNVSSTSSSVVGNLVLSSNILDNQDIVNIDNSSGVCVPVNQIYMILGSSQNSVITDIDVTVSVNSQYGDINYDCQTNVLDIIILVDIILGNYNGGQTVPNDVFNDSDINDDGSVDIVDIVALINEILDILW